MHRQKTDDDGDAVSEILGVIMMLAMVITIMGGVWIFLNPYLVAFHDNTNWHSASNIADRIEDRIDVVGDSPEGTGTQQALSIKSSSINPANLVEEWIISSDLTPYEVVQVDELNASSFQYDITCNSFHFSGFSFTQPELSIPPVNLPRLCPIITE